MDYTKVPVENIYYLLCYAWDKLDQKDKVPVDQCDKEDCSSLFTKVLTEGTKRLLKHGLDRGYVLHKDRISRIKGKIDFTESMNTDFMVGTCLVCEYDEFDYNILHNQILKTTLRYLMRCETLKQKYKDELVGIYRRLNGIEEVPLTKRLFGMVKLHRNNLFYDFIMKVCELVFDNLVPSEDNGKFVFQDFQRNHQKMASLFEEFVRNFYKKELQGYSVYSESIEWDISDNESSESRAVLPKMNTDISMTSASGDRKIIIDTKFYSKTLAENYEKEIAHSANIYQIFAYIMNTKNRSGLANKTCEGILLYPVVQKEHSYEWTIKGHRIAIQTINLNQNWRDIHNDLIKIIK